MTDSQREAHQRICKAMARLEIARRVVLEAANELEQVDPLWKEHGAILDLFDMVNGCRKDLEPWAHSAAPDMVNLHRGSL